MTNCVNCGAVLHGNKCEYCGTEYNGNSIIANFDKCTHPGVLTIGERQYEVYIGCVEGTVMGPNVSRTPDGRLMRRDCVMKHKFTLIEL